MKKRYLIAFLLVTFTGLLFIACDISKINGKDFEETSDDEEIEDLACTVQGINALEGYIAKWENCKNESTGEWQHRVMLRELGGDLLVQVSDEENSGYSPLIWINGGHLMVMYAENNSDHQEVILYANLIKLKVFTINGELVSEEILLEDDPVTFGTFQMPFGKIEREPNSTLIYWADNKVEGISRAAHIVEIKNGEVSGRQYMKGVRDVSTPHAIMDRGQYLFTFMSGLNQEEMDAEQIESDTNSIFLVETDELFQPLESETIINIGGDSDWGVRPSVALLGSSYAVVFLSNNEPAPNLNRLNIRVYDSEAGEVIHSETAEQYTYINYQAVTDATGNLAVFYTESDGGLASGAYNLRVTTMNKDSFHTEDHFVMSLTNPNFYAERVDGNDIRLYHGGTSSGSVTATQINLGSVGQ